MASESENGIDPAESALEFGGRAADRPGVYPGVERRLHSGRGYVTPLTKLEGKEKEVWAERDQKLENARAKRAEMRRQERMGEKPKTGLTEKLSFSVSR